MADSTTRGRPETTMAGHVTRYAAHNRAFHTPCGLGGGRASNCGGKRRGNKSKLYHAFYPLRSKLR